MEHNEKCESSNRLYNKITSQSCESTMIKVQNIIAVCIALVNRQAEYMELCESPSKLYRVL